MGTLPGGPSTRAEPASFSGPARALLPAPRAFGPRPRGSEASREGMGNPPRVPIRRVRSLPASRDQRGPSSPPLGPSALALVAAKHRGRAWAPSQGAHRQWYGVAHGPYALASKRRHQTNAFVYRAGIGVAGTHITCDAAGFPSDLVFISHAYALGAGGPARLANERAGRRQVVVTDETLRLLGQAGAKLRSRALPAVFGRPFDLGGERIEIVRSGFLPGAAGLVCQRGQHRAFYLGAFNPEPIVPGIAPADMRHADAICIDATLGHPDLVFPPRRQVLAELRAFVQSTLAEGRTPVLLASTAAALPTLAYDLAQAGIPLRAHTRFAAELSRLHEVCSAIPAMPRASRKPSPDQALLWPVEARSAVVLRALRAPRLALVSGSAAIPEVLSRMQVDQGFALTSLPSHEEILAAVEMSGAREVALFHAGADELASHLRSRGFHAYPLGPPKQMTLV
jgi:hypothetical protein